MPRKPTGRPTGRPPGSGKLGDHTRLTVRIPRTLYDRLDTYAAGRSFTRGTPQLAMCVREALEAYLDSKRQTKTVPALARDEIQQTKTVLLPSRDTIRQTKTIPTPARDAIQQTAREPISSTPMLRDAGALDAMPRELDKSVPASFDTSRFYLGTLCPHGHAHEGTGKSLRRHSKGDCHACDLARKRTTRQAKRQTAPGA